MFGLSFGMIVAKSITKGRLPSRGFSLSNKNNPYPGEEEIGFGKK
jgi:hypothetical protein